MNSNPGSFARRACCVFLLLPVISLCASAQAHVVAVGDVHGSYTHFVNILQRTGLIDAGRQWIGGSAVLLQLGDVPHRGAQTRECLDLLMELERQAPKQGGRVIPLLGNHEIMTMMGDLRYLSPEEIRQFAAEQSEKVREQAWEDYRKFLAARNSRRQLPAPPQEPAVRDRWMSEHPPGLFEQRDALGPQGQYGRWLRRHDAVAQVGDDLFVHGGVNPRLRFRNIGELNGRVRSELAKFDSVWQWLSDKKIIWRYMKLEEAVREAQEELTASQSPAYRGDPETPQKIRELMDSLNSILTSADGPLWYRGYSKDPEDDLKGELDALMARLKVRHIVVGHTITGTFRILPRFDNRVFMIDTAMMLEGKQGRASALDIQNGRYTAVYLNEQQVLLAPPGSGAVPAFGGIAAQGAPAPKVKP